MLAPANVQATRTWVSGSNGNSKRGLNAVLGAAVPLLAVFDNVASIANSTGLLAEGAETRAYITCFDAERTQRD
jgi:hypothetical protein